VAEALVALGGNLGDTRATLDRAVTLFCDGLDVKLRARSSDYRTPPWGDPDQPPFINLCIAVSTSLGARALLKRAQSVERALGRERDKQQRFGPRTVDLDLIAYDDLTLDEPGLTLPHPRWFERAFVLVPLAEIAPERIIGGIRLRDALAHVDTTGIERLPPLLNSSSDSLS
jgi:2-amino-4-hydroxy-6-hydroxymethyldihydropteridine diphosphokinase